MRWGSNRTIDHPGFPGCPANLSFLFANKCRQVSEQARSRPDVSQLGPERTEDRMGKTRVSKWTKEKWTDACRKCVTFALATTLLSTNISHACVSFTALLSIRILAHSACSFQRFICLWVSLKMSHFYSLKLVHWNMSFCYVWTDLGRKTFAVWYNDLWLCVRLTDCANPYKSEALPGTKKTTKKWCEIFLLQEFLRGCGCWFFLVSDKKEKKRKQATSFHPCIQLSPFSFVLFNLSICPFLHRNCLFQGRGVEGGSLLTRQPGSPRWTPPLPLCPVCLSHNNRTVSGTTSDYVCEPCATLPLHSAKWTARDLFVQPGNKP